MTKLKKSPGRPRSTNKRQTRTLTITNDAWSGLRRQADAQGISISELNEKLGMQELAIINTKQEKLYDTSIYQRLQGYMEEPYAGFESLLAFIEKSIDRLIHETQSQEVVEEQVAGIAIGMMSILYFSSYLYPDISIKSFSACMPWLAYRFLQNIGFPNADAMAIEKTSLDSEDIVEGHLRKVRNTLARLERSQFDFYPVLRMRFIEGLSIEQIYRILHLRNKNISDSEIRDRVKQALGRFRELCRGSIENPYELDNAVLDKANPVNVLNFPEKDARLYCQLLRKMYWCESEQNQLKGLLRKASEKTQLAFWFAELNSLVHSERLEDIQKNLQRKIADNFESHLAIHRDQVDLQLMYCTSRKDVENLLQKIIKYQISHVRQTYFQKLSASNCKKIDFDIADIQQCQYLLCS